MNTTFMLGAEVDIATSGEVQDSVNSAADRIIGGLRERRPLPIAIPQSGVMPTAGPLILSFGDPSGGSMWNVTDVVVTGSDDRTAVVAGVAALYIGNSSAFTLGQLLRPGQAIPGFWTFSKGALWVHQGEELVLVVYGAAAQTNIAAVARISEYPASMAEARSI